MEEESFRSYCASALTVVAHIAGIMKRRVTPPLSSVAVGNLDYG